MLSKTIKPVACTLAAALFVSTSNLPAIAAPEDNKYDVLTTSETGLSTNISLVDQIEDYISAQSQEISNTTEEVSFAQEDTALVSADQLISVEGNTVTFPLPGSDGETVQVAIPATSTDSPLLSSSQESVIFAESPQDDTLHEVKAIDGGVPQLTSVQLAPDETTHTQEHRYDFVLPEGYELFQLPDGSAGIIEWAENPINPTADEVEDALRSILPTEEEVQRAIAEQQEETNNNVLDLPVGAQLVTYFQNPWSVDANGVELETALVVEGDSIIQQVHTENAVFPVVSDPLPLVAIALGAAARALAPHVIRAFAVQTIRAGAQYTVRGGYHTFDAFKRAAGTKNGYQWHHIVEQSTIRNRGWDPRAIHNGNNLVQIPTQVHQRCINSWMAQKGVRQFGAYASSGQTMRQWVHQQSFSTQHRIGVNLLRHCGVQL